MYQQNTPGENLGSGHFYLAKTRTFLLCVDTNLLPEIVLLDSKARLPLHPMLSHAYAPRTRVPGNRTLGTTKSKGSGDEKKPNAVPRGIEQHNQPIS
jgi:hypothetical protein